MSSEKSIVYIEAITALFVIVDPIGNIPLFLQLTRNIPQKLRQKTFSISVIVSACILLFFAFAGDIVLRYVFHIKMADLRIAGGMLLVVIAIEDMVFGSKRRPASFHNTVSPQQLACVPLACPLLAGPGAMVTSLATWRNPAAGPGVAVAAIIVVLGIFWLIMRFVDTIYRLLGELIPMAVSKVMLVFLAAIGANMVITGLLEYFGSPK